MQQQSFVSRITRAVRGAVEDVRSRWSGPLMSNSPELLRLFAEPPASSGIHVTVDTALTYSAFFAAVQLIAGDVASLPLKVYRRLPNGGRERMPQHPLSRMLDSIANPESAAMNVRETITAHCLVTGNGYAEIARNQYGQPVELHPLSPDRVTVLRDGPRLRYRVTNYNGADTFIDAEDMFHLRGLSLDGIVGVSVVRYARESLGLALASERYGGTYFSNNCQIGGLLRHPGQLSPQARKNLLEAVNVQHRGVASAHKLLLVEEGVEYTPFGLSNEDSQFLESRQFQVAEICRWFNLNPVKLSDMSRATYSNAEQSAIDYYTNTLRRWLTRWEAEIQLKLVAPSERSQMFAEHLTDAILRGDIATRYAAYRSGREGGWLSINDIRRMENLDPVDGGDDFLQPLNMGVVGGTK